jgi:hypothetical protein
MILSLIRWFPDVTSSQRKGGSHIHRDHEILMTQVNEGGDGHSETE